MSRLLETRGLTLEMGGRRLLDGLDLGLAAGRILGLAGPSGSGKSLTLLSLARLLPDNARLSGEIRLAGQALQTATEAELCRLRGRDIGLVFQEPQTALNPLRTIAAQVAETVRQHGGTSRREAGAIALARLAEVGLAADLGDRYPHQLSGGQRQRAAIAIAVALRPRLLLADEPTTALDVTTQAAILALLAGLAKSHAMAMILVSHDLTAIASIADDLAVMDEGRIVEQGEAAQLLTRPAHAATRALLAGSATPEPTAPRPAAADRPLLSARGITRRYRWPGFRRGPALPPALDGVDLDLRAGEILAIVGESGSGKSTLLRRLLGLDEAGSGSVLLNGEAFPAARPGIDRRLRRQIQAVFQDPYGSFDPRWSVARIVAEPLALLDAPAGPGERRRLVEEALRAVGLAAGDADRFAHQFSGGQRQRIALARALVLAPAIIALDEATSALDLPLKRQILDLLANLVRRRGTALLFATHDLLTVRGFADRIIVMYRGRVVETGTAAEIFTRPADPYTRALLAAAPSLEQILESRAADRRAGGQ